jgi:hypothetical protein
MVEVSRGPAVPSADPDTAWRLCTRGITPGRARIDGDRQLAAAALQIVSII